MVRGNLHEPVQPPTQTERPPQCGWNGCSANTAAGRTTWWRAGIWNADLSRRQHEEGSDYGGNRRGWFLGDDALKQELLTAAIGGVGPHHYGEAVQESAEVRAKRLVAEEVRPRGWQGGCAGV